MKQKNIFIRAYLSNLLCGILCAGNILWSAAPANLPCEVLTSLKNDIRSFIAFDDETPKDIFERIEIKKQRDDLTYSQGVSGKAMVIVPKETASAEYLSDQPLMKGSGSLACWIKPVKWVKREEADSRGYIVFFRVSIGGGAFIIQRQGFQKNPNRMDYLLLMLNRVTEGTPLAVGDVTDKWEDETWYFLVMNWNTLGFSYSINGKELKTLKYPRELTENDFGSSEPFTIGAGGGGTDLNELTLIDEITVFSRELNQTEIRRLYSSGLERSENNADTGSKKTGSINEKIIDSDTTASATLPIASIGWTTNFIPVEITAPFMRAPNIPVIDGVFKEDEWKSASRQYGAYAHEHTLESREVIHYIGSDGKKIFIAVRSELPPDKTLTANHQPQKGKDVPEAFNDDSLELWFMPDVKKNSKMYAIIFNKNGAVYDFIYDTAAKKVDTAWSSEIEYKGSETGAQWQAELSIPARVFGTPAVSEQVPWGVRIVRNFKRPPVQADWTPFFGAFNKPDSMGIVTWDSAAPLIRFDSLLSKDLKKADISFSIQNGPSAQQVIVDTYWITAGNPEFTRLETLNLKPNEIKTIKVVDNNSLGLHYFVSFIVKSGKTGSTLFAKKFSWLTRGWENKWTVAGESGEARFNFGYYPYENILKTFIDVSVLPSKDLFNTAYFTISGKDGKMLFKSPDTALKNYSAESEIKIPELPEGTYTVDAFALQQGMSGVKAASRSFIRKKFPWEQNTIGVSDVVIPPYTPLVVSGNTVKAVLREHVMSDTGIPEQIQANSKNILAQPVYFKTTIDGKEEKAVITEKIKFSRTDANKALYRSKWRVGALTVTLDGFFDYDGMLKMRLTLDGKPDTRLDTFDLIIPIADCAEFLHVISDTGKACTALPVPAGSNPVWESMYAEHNQYAVGDGVVGRLSGTFLPYIWIGNENRGICWFADNDKDWLVNDRRSCIDINKFPDRTELRIRFVTKPGLLERRRKIIFALQATPTKPMPAAPSYWRNIVFSMPHLGQGTHTAAIIGSAWQWGGDDFYAFYPRNKDFSVYSLIRDARNNNYNADAWSTWIEGYNPSHPHIDRIKRNIQSGAGIARSRPSTIIPYTDMRGLCVNEEDFLTFQDEWVIYPFSPRKWPEWDTGGTYGYDTTPCESRQDYILWYFNKMLDSGAMDGIYYDVTYPVAVRNSVTGKAFRGDDGRMRASADIFAARELFKRSAVLAFQKRGYNMNIAHMTYTLLAPLHTWFGAILDWEVRYGMDDFQDRFTRHYIRTVSLGKQTGTMPLALGSLGISGSATPERRSFVCRTLTGCLVTHEIRDWAVGWGNEKVYENTLKTMYSFGYGKTDCAVYNYWDKDFPAIISGVDHASLLLVRNGAAMLIICDYGSGGTASITLKGTQLGLKDNGSFIDAETEKPVEHNQPFSCKLPIERHDFKIISYK